MIKFKNKKLYAFLIFLFMPVMSGAEVYKWVDENGITHYSQKKPIKDRTTKLKMHAQPTSTKTSGEMFQEKEQKRRLKINKENVLKKKPIKSAKKKRPKAVSGGREDGTDSSRCALARDILNGSLRHSNGKPIDAYDIKTAKNDIRKFCR